MHHVSLVAVVDGVDDLPERLASVHFRHASVLGDVIYKHTALLSANGHVKVDYRDPCLLLKDSLTNRNNYMYTYNHQKATPSRRNLQKMNMCTYDTRPPTVYMYVRERACLVS